MGVQPLGRWDIFSFQSQDHLSQSQGKHIASGQLQIHLFQSIELFITQKSPFPALRAPFPSPRGRDGVAD